MFGKKRSVNDSFVMAQGRAAGNLKKVTKKSPTAKPPMKGESNKKAAPFVRVASARQKMGSVGTMKEELK